MDERDELLLSNEPSLLCLVFLAFLSPTNSEPSPFQAKSAVNMTVGLQRANVFKVNREKKQKIRWSG